MSIDMNMEMCRALSIVASLHHQVYTPISPFSFLYFYSSISLLQYSLAYPSPTSLITIADLQVRINEFVGKGSIRGQKYE